MYNRIINDIDDCESYFLFGARQTGKTSLLRHLFPSAVYIDLLESDLRRRLLKNPELLYQMLEGKEPGTLVIIDEIQQVPELLNEVHRLMTYRQFRFILSGSSARKLKRQGTNTLGGRAIPLRLYPLVSAEIPDFDLEKALACGMLPRHYLKPNPWKLLQAYVDVYLQEEVKAESLVRNLVSFNRFLQAAALTDGEIVNYNNIASDCGVSSVTAKEYFSILTDTLIGYMVPAFTKVVKRRVVQSPKFYLFDVGVVNYLLGRQSLQPGTPEYGHAFEHFVMQELLAYIGYHYGDSRLTYWRTQTGVEVDAVVEQSRVAIEIKSTAEALPRHAKGLRSFAMEYPDYKLILVSQDRINRSVDGVSYYFILDFLADLWSGRIL